MERRHFIQLGIATFAAAYALNGQAAITATADMRFLSAVDDAEGRHFIAAANAHGRELFRIPVSERCHSGCLRPGSDQAAILSRRSGKFLHIINMMEGTIDALLEAEDGFHFYGHGVYGPKGDELYVTANHYPTGAGLIRVYDAHNAYRHVRDLPVGGMDPHELRLHPDGRTLVVALGGIHTHPDYGRVKLNLETMQPALVVMDRLSGTITQRCEPSHHQLSCHHLDISPEGVVIAGYQYEGPVWDTPPLIARLDTRSGAFSEVLLTPEQQAGTGNYMASVAVSHISPLAAVTAPRGNKVILLDYLSGKPVRTIEVPDAGGVLAERDGSFIVSSGHGGLYRVSHDNPESLEISWHALRWDNHLTRA